MFIFIPSLFVSYLASTRLTGLSWNIWCISLLPSFFVSYFWITILTGLSWTIGVYPYFLSVISWVPVLQGYILIFALIVTSSIRVSYTVCAEFSELNFVICVDRHFQYICQLFREYQNNCVKSGHLNRSSFPVLFLSYLMSTRSYWAQLAICVYLR